MRKRLLKLGLVAALGAVGFLVFLHLTKPSFRINRASFEQIEHGMTVQDVTNITGVPPGDYCNTPMKLIGHVYDEIWWSDNGLILLTLDEAGLVTGKEFIHVNDDSPLDRIRRLLRLD